MISVFFGIDDEADYMPDSTFEHTYCPEWFDDEDVRRMVLDIDKTTVQSRHCFLSPVLGQIPPHYLSGGVKGMIMLYKTDWYYPDLVNFGENCEEWLVWIFNHKDIVRVSCSGYDLTFRDMPIRGICENDGSQINNHIDWALKMGEFVPLGKRNLDEGNIYFQN